MASRLDGYEEQRGSIGDARVNGLTSLAARRV